MRSIALFLLFASLIGCNSLNAPAEPKLGEEVEIGYGDYAALPEEGIIVQFNAVKEYRCPVNVTCVWAGNAEVTLRVNGEEIVLNTHSKMQRSVDIDGYTVQLRKVFPEPVHGLKLKTEEYRITVVVTNS